MAVNLSAYRVPIALAGVALAIVVLIALGGGGGGPEQRPPARPEKPPTTRYARPEMTIDVQKKYTAIFETTRGRIVCELFPKEAPITVNNFVSLAQKKFYDGTVFHRVIADFMIQGGDPTATGQGGPGYEFEDEVGEGKPVFATGSLAMANAGPGTNGSQFFITHKPTPWLQGKHTIFGQVREGQDVIDAVRQGDTLKSVTIEVK